MRLEGGLVNAGGYFGSLEIGGAIGAEGFVGDGSNQMKEKKGMQKNRMKERTSSNFVHWKFRGIFSAISLP